MGRLGRRTVILAALALVLAACGGDDGGESGGAAAGGGGLIGFSQANNGDVWRIDQTKDVQSNCSSLMPDSEVVVTDGQGQAAKQSADVDDLLARGVKVLLLTPLTAEALTPVAKRAMDAGIPVVTLDRAVDTEVTQHIGADNKLIGQKAAEYVANTVLEGKGGKVIEIQGVLGASATTDRNKEFVGWLKENAPDVEIVASQTGEYRREPALKYMEDMLQRFGPGEFDVVYAHNDEMALGAIQALKAANRLDEVKVVGIDGQNEAIQAIANGDMAATFTYDNAGKEACESAQKLLAGEKNLQKQWVLQTTQIDATNAAQWVGKGF